MQASSEATGGRLEVHVQSFTITPRRGQDAEPVEGINVYGFLPGSQGGDYEAAGVRFPNAVQLVEALGGRIQLDHDEPFGTSIAIVLSA